MALKDSSFPIWNFSHMYFNFAFWKYSLHEKGLGPCSTCFAQTLFSEIELLLCFLTCQDLDATSTILLKEGIEQYAIQTI